MAHIHALAFMGTRGDLNPLLWGCLEGINGGRIVHLLTADLEGVMLEMNETGVFKAGKLQTLTWEGDARNHKFIPPQNCPPKVECSEEKVKLQIEVNTVSFVHNSSGGYLTVWCPV